jgi:hypothetical protein
MSALDELLNNMPNIEHLDVSLLPEPICYIGAAGFEDRVFGILNKTIRVEKKIDRVIGIEYRPYNKKNRIDEFKDTLNKLAVPETKILWSIYDRYVPDEFIEEIFRIVNFIPANYNIVVDISAMSKLLIVVLLHGLRELPNRVTIVYTEAEIYHPTPEAYKATKMELYRETENPPVFLTTDIYNIVTTQSLSSVAMQGFPLLMVAFPTFNHRELIALINDITPQHLILLEGKPHEGHNYWRRDAIKDLNRKIMKSVYLKNDFPPEERRIISTFDYKETIRLLEEIYDHYKYNRKIIVVPTGSKLQSVGIFLFKQMHPDIQIIYPVTKGFADGYTEGSRAYWQAVFDGFTNWNSVLDDYRRYPLHELKRFLTS